MPTKKTKNVWLDHLIMCPSQCYCHVAHNRRDYILYLRWRWNDPWKGYVIEGADSTDLGNGIWSQNLLEGDRLFFREDELERAKSALVELFSKAYGVPKNASFRPPKESRYDL